mmetsp:Transcript_93609/g.247508  ORF Transcript_93609/g.247508 Transcript_93609/m.247508 type:complete len:459 (-) Transcript_93609:151-1527(-)
MSYTNGSAPPPMPVRAASTASSAAKPNRRLPTMWMSTMSLVVFLYEGFAYNAIFLWRILPAVGKEQLVLPFACLFNPVLGLALWSYARARVADPGALPGRWHEFVRQVGEALPVVPSRHAWQPGRATYCDKCGNPRPERAHHCLTCDMCVMRMDHHCPWISNCVGIGNHKFFLLLGFYGWLAGVVGIVTTAPELLYCGEALWRRGPEALELGIWSTNFVMYEGYISAGENIKQELTTVSEARDRCAEMQLCRGFCFQSNSTEGADGPERVMVYYKTKWDNVPNNVHSSGWSSYRLEQASRLAASSVLAFLVGSCLAVFISVLLYVMMSGHVPLANHNVTTIESNYDGSANPYEQGSIIANLEQVLGKVGLDWFLPIDPCHPLTDGISFLRSDEQWDDGAPMMPGGPGPWGGPEGMLMDTGPFDIGDETERLWRARYRVYPPVVDPKPMGEPQSFWGCH